IPASTLYSPGRVVLIPHNTLRYTVLGIAVGVVFLWLLCIKHPMTQLQRLRDTINDIQNSLAHSALDISSISLTSGASQRASIIQCRILKTERVTWKAYRHLSRDVTQYVANVEKIRTAVQLLQESEHQRKLASDMNETRFILTSHGVGSAANTSNVTVNYDFGHRLFSV
ncbi:hypothetical protein C8R43DRAFT_1187785, partial [Mycena crocata]